MIKTSFPPVDAFRPDQVPPDLTELNVRILNEHASRPDPWSLPVAVVRQAREDGKSIFPPPRPDPDAELKTVRAPDGHQAPIRIIRPRTREARGVFMHMHGGGWLFGAARENDPRLRRLAEATGLATVSVDYRLAPEHPFPAAFDDCLAVALALVDQKSLDLPDGFFAIGGESAGAQLSVVTLLRLRDECGLNSFKAANLVAGFYDLSLTPSASRADEPRLIINSEDLRRFGQLSAPAGGSLRDPSVSPLYADLRGMPPARFSCGSVDMLRDDTLFMANRWAAAGNESTLAITPGGCHVFEAFGTPSGEASLSAAEDFLNAQISRAA